MSQRISVHERTLVERTQLLGGLDEGEARTALRATVAALGAPLPNGERAALAEVLPDALTGIIRNCSHHPTPNLGDFFEHVRQREGTSLGFAKEHAEVVCRVLSESLPDDVVRRVAAALPATFGDLFRSLPTPESPPAHRIVPGPHHHSLATGKPGSLQPLSEAHPPGAHAHSVVCETNPHGDTKVSSTKGTTQERERESLATNEPQSRRTIADSSD